MRPFIVDSSQGEIQVYLDSGTVTVVPVHPDGLAKREEFEQYDDVDELARFIGDVAEIPEREGRRIAQELVARFPVIRRSRWRPWRRRDRQQ